MHFNLIYIVQRLQTDVSLPGGNSAYIKVSGTEFH